MHDGQHSMPFWQRAREGGPARGAVVTHLERVGVDVPSSLGRMPRFSGPCGQEAEGNGAERARFG
jgi:hypothetical protein